MHFMHNVYIKKDKKWEKIRLSMCRCIMYVPCEFYKCKNVRSGLSDHRKHRYIVLNYEIIVVSLFH